MAKKESQSSKTFEWQLVKRIISYARKYKGLFLLALLLTLLSGILGPIRPFLFQKILDGPVVTGDIAGIRWWVLVLISVLVVQSVVHLANNYLTSWLGQSVIVDMRTQVFDHILRLKMKFYDKTPIGTLQTRAISDIETLNTVFSQAMVGILGEILQLIVILILMFISSWKLTLVVLSVLPILLYSTYIFKNKIRVAFQKVRDAVSSMNSFLQEHISGILIIQIFNREKKEAERFKKHVDDHTKANISTVLYYSIYFPVIEFISALALALIVWYGTSGVLAGEFTFGILVAFIMYISMFFRPIRMLADRFNTLQLGIVSAERIFKVLDTQEIIPDEGKITLPNDNSYTIEFNNVSFAYNVPEWVINNISFTVKAGQKVAIVGATGAGKSTIINLLSRFYELDKGEISINGKSITTIPLGELRKLVGLVLQDVFLFSGTIADNISLRNPEINREDIIKASKDVGAHSFIMKFPGGYDFDVQERGGALSAGQRQLISFVRVLVFNPAILILDEATSNVDSDSEEIIQTAIDKVLANRTSIIIAHRLSTIQKADQILVMEYGEIIERGSHNELLKKEGTYFQLKKMEFEDKTLP